MASESDLPVPDTRVLAIASHVVYGYVGNTMATFVMQSLGCEVAALNTVQFSNHLGYGQARGTRATATEISDLYTGLTDSHLADFDMMLSGYLPGASAVEAVGAIARDLKYKAIMKPGSFFWVLDPVMGDNGKLYVEESCVPAYKGVLRDADLMVPNQFEAETLSGVKIVDMETLKQAITALHDEYKVPHVVVTSISLPGIGVTPSLSVVGSTFTSGYTPRIFEIKIPALNCFFSGTGDMFAALMVVRLREAVSKIEGLGEKQSWVSGDEVGATELPLAKACEKVLASMHEVLSRTKMARDADMERYEARVKRSEVIEDEKKLRLAKSKAAEVRLVRNLDCLREPKERFVAEGFAV